MKYKCMFPGCEYEASNRKMIDYHHIVPKELGGSDISRNRMYVCPVHHRHIYAPGTESGIHSSKCEGAIIVKGFLTSTAGKVLHYVSCDDDKDYFFFYRENAIVLAESL
jgi:hypothetical protein